MLCHISCILILNPQPHYNHESCTFNNPWDSFSGEKWYDGLVCLWDLHPLKPPTPENKPEYLSIDWEKIQNFHSEYKDRINYTWFGHSSCLIQMDGFNILTDPIFSDRCRYVLNPYFLRIHHTIHFASNIVCISFVAPLNIQDQRGMMEYQSIERYISIRRCYI